MKHVNAFACPLCDEKLKGVHPDLVLFANRFRGYKQDAHVSWGLRGQDDQEKFLAAGTSKAAFGESPHNFGMALDWFRLHQNGAEFNVDWYLRFLVPAAREAGLRCGADWPKFKDYPHVEIADWKLLTKRTA